MARTNRLPTEGTANLIAAARAAGAGPLSEWLPEVATMLDAPEPRLIPPWAARIAAGPFGVACMTELRGADNRGARRRLAWAPGHIPAGASLTAELARPAHAA